MSENAERLLGELDGKMDLVLQRLDKINGTINKHSAWIAGHEQFHATQGKVAGGAWQVALLILSPAVAALVGWAMRGLVR